MFTTRLAAIGGAALILFAGPALAGEVKGNGQLNDNLNGRSICSFSGLNDDNPPAGHTQSFGQNVRAGRLDPTDYDPDYDQAFPFPPYPYPGWACDPNNIDLHADD